MKRYVRVNIRDIIQKVSDAFDDFSLVTYDDEIVVWTVSGQKCSLNYKRMDPEEIEREMFDQSEEAASADSHMDSVSDYTSIEEAHSIIDSIPMTKGRRNSLYEIREWNVDPEDVVVLAGRDGNGMIRFNSTDKVVSVSYGYSSKVYQAFILEYEDGSKRMYGWDVDRSSYDGSEQKYWRYLGRV